MGDRPTHRESQGGVPALPLQPPKLGSSFFKHHNRFPTTQNQTTHPLECHALVRWAETINPFHDDSGLHHKNIYDG